MASKKPADPTSLTVVVTVPCGPVSLVAIQRTALLAKRDQIPLSATGLDYEVTPGDLRTQDKVKVRDYSVKISWGTDGDAPVDVDAAVAGLAVPTVGDLAAATADSSPTK